jgi:hypothetical protein
MRPHIHVGIATGLSTFAAIIVIGVVWRTAAYKLIERNDGSPLGQAMLYAY